MTQRVHRPPACDADSSGSTEFNGESSAHSVLNSASANSHAPLRLIEQVSDDSGDIEIEAGADRPLIPVGSYLARYVSHEAVSLRMFKGANRIFIHFALIDPPHAGVRLYGAWPLKSIGKQGGKTRLHVNRRSGLFNMLCRVLGHRVRPDRISPAALKGCVVRVRTRTVEKNFRQQRWADCLKYSIVDDIEGIVAGDR